MTTTKLIGAAIIITGIYVGYKNHKKDGFWPGIGAGFLVSWGANILLKK